MLKLTLGDNVPFVKTHTRLKKNLRLKRTLDYNEISYNEHSHNESRLQGLFALFLTDRYTQVL